MNSQVFYTPGLRPHEKTAAPRPAVPPRWIADAARMAFRWFQLYEPAVREQLRNSGFSDVLAPLFAC